MTHLISAVELAQELGGVTVLDVRWELTTAHTTAGRDDYDAGHVPGAYFVDLDAELAAPPGEGGRHPLPDPLVVQAVLRRAGITPRSRVVAYDGAQSYAAARAWWVLRWLGIPDVRVLDGGYAAWLAAGLPVSTEAPADRQGDVEVVTPGQLPTLDADAAARLAREGLLLDARAPERYAGETEPIDPVAGHVPGAVNSPTTAWLAPDGTFRRDLAEHWASVRDGRGSVVGEHPEVGESGGIGVYCGSGVTAAHYLLALAELGIDAALYPGSWSEWIRDASRPVATGPEPG